MNTAPASALMTADDLLNMPGDTSHQYELVRGS
jgi:hypothetical protein